MSSMVPRQAASSGLSPSRRRFQRSVRRRSGRKPKDNDEIEVPSKFGNAADYWKHFDQVASARNRQMVDSMNQNLDLLLVFGGLFAGVNSGFLAYAIPLLNPDPAAQTTFLLRLLITGGMNQTLTEDQLKAPDFTPPPNVIYIGRLFTISLTLTLLAAFGAMVGKQWMIYYTRGSQGGPSEGESRQLQRKLSGVHRCGLRFLVELALPSLLQIALFVFSVGFIFYLKTLNNNVAYINSILAWIGVAAFGITIIHAVWDPYCPFQTPVSQFLWFMISLPFDMIPGIILVLVKRFPKKLIKKATGGLFKSFIDGWRNPYKVAKTETEIITNTVDQSYFRTLSHRLKFDPFSAAVSRIRRQEDPTDVMDARYTCHMLRRMEQPEILRAVAQSVPTLFDKKAMTILLKDKAVIRLHRLFRASIAQAEDAPDALVQDSEDKSNPAVNAVIYGRAIIHLFISLGPHDDWFWDDYETALHHGWLEPWSLEGVDAVPDNVMMELEHQRRIIQACLSIGPDNDPPTTEVEDSALPLYIAASIKALLHRRMYHHLSHYPPKFRPTVEHWMGEADLERVAFCSVFPEDYPKAIGLVAWALATVPKREYHHGMPVLEKYRMFWSDLEELWDAYSSTSNILNNVAKALKAYPLDTTKPSDENHLSTIEIKKAYKAMLEAVIKYVKEHAIKEDVLASGPHLIDVIGGLKAKMKKDQELTEEDEDIKATLQPIIDAIVVRRGRRLRQHVRSMSESIPENRLSPLLEKEWFSGNTPAALEDYSEWITTHRSSSPDPTSEPRDLFLSRWNQERGPREQRVDLEPSEDDGDEENPRR
ncbi:hypothetical protein FRC04_004789 [Tulasnella sp. 424]|nr:hypothetical protein FRC04_004789 [Tulasnella sp. 424]KAG8976281.1 hypothetical protein FRC05_004197 [Tulasnella sp. 425]